MNYTVKHSKENVYARACLKCNKIVLGVKWRGLPSVLRSFILLHEEGHLNGMDSEIDADTYAYNKQKDDRIFRLLELYNLRTLENIKLLKENVK